MSTRPPGIASTPPSLICTIHLPHSPPFCFSEGRTSPQSYPPAVEVAAFDTSPWSQGHHPVFGSLRVSGVVDQGAASVTLSTTLGSRRMSIFWTIMGDLQQLPMKGPPQRVVMALLCGSSAGKTLGLTSWGFMSTGLASTRPLGAGERQCSFLLPSSLAPLAHNPPVSFKEGHCSSSSPPLSSAEGRM